MDKKFPLVIAALLFVMLGTACGQKLIRGESPMVRIS